MLPAVQKSVPCKSSRAVGNQSLGLSNGGSFHVHCCRCLSYNLVQVAVHSWSQLLSSIFFLSDFTGSSVRMLPVASLVLLVFHFRISRSTTQGKKGHCCRNTANRADTQSNRRWWQSTTVDKKPSRRPGMAISYDVKQPCTSTGILSWLYALVSI